MEGKREELSTAATGGGAFLEGRKRNRPPVNAGALGHFSSYGGRVRHPSCRRWEPLVSSGWTDAMNLAPPILARYDNKSFPLLKLKARLSGLLPQTRALDIR